MTSCVTAMPAPSSRRRLSSWTDEASTRPSVNIASGTRRNMRRSVDLSRPAAMRGAAARGPRLQHASSKDHSTSNIGRLFRSFGGPDGRLARVVGLLSASADRSLPTDGVVQSARADCAIRAQERYGRPSPSGPSAAAGRRPSDHSTAKRISSARRVMPSFFLSRAR